MGVFTREESETLAYDEDAFFYFAGTVLMIIILPWTFALVRGIWLPPLPDDYQGLLPPKRQRDRGSDLRERVCGTESMEEHRRRARNAQLSLAHRFRFSVKVQLAILCILWFAFASVLGRVQRANDLRVFDPHETLGLTRNADEKEIKKAYRRMSLIAHPDKNPDDPLAAANFHKISKAYSVLTDEQARRNYEKYGNPDGPDGMKLSVALHPAMMEKRNQIFTLCVFFLFLFVLVPACALFYYYRTKDYANGVFIESLQMLALSVDAATRAREGLSLLAATRESREIMSRVPGSHLQPLFAVLAERRKAEAGGLEPGTLVEVFGLKSAQELNGKNGQITSFVTETGRYEVQIALGEKPKAIKPENLRGLQPSSRDCLFSDASILRGYHLLAAHVERLHALMDLQAREALDTLLRQTVKVSAAMVGIAVGAPGDRSRFFDCARGLIGFQQSLVQAIDIDGPQLLQLPHVTSSMLESSPELKHMQLAEAVADPAALVRKLEGLTPAQVMDIRLVCSYLPRVEIEAKVYVEDEDVIAEEDVATLRVTLRRTNLVDGEGAGSVHAPFFPLPRYETWWVLAVDEHSQRLVLSERIRGQSREEEVKCLFQVSRHGAFSWRVYALCDSYIGLDASVAVGYTALTQKQANRTIFVHPHDLHMRRSFFEELMLGLQPPESEDESESDEGESEKVSQSDPLVAVSAEAASDDEEETGPGGSIYLVVAPNGAPIMSNLVDHEDKARLGWCPPGRLLRGVEEIEVDDGARVLLVLANGTDRPPSYVCISRRASPHREQYLKLLGPFQEQPLKNVVSTVTPVALVKRWMKHNEPSRIDKDDMFRVEQIENGYVRLQILAMAQEKLGSARYADLAQQVARMEALRAELVAKTRGVWADDSGSKWRVTPDLIIQGMPVKGQRIRDKLEVVEGSNGELRCVKLGPFVLDQVRSVGCCVWVHADNPSIAMMWRPDRALSSRMQFMW